MDESFEESGEYEPNKGFDTMKINKMVLDALNMGKEKKTEKLQVSKKHKKKKHKKKHKKKKEEKEVNKFDTIKVNKMVSEALQEGDDMFDDDSTLDPKLNAFIEEEEEEMKEKTKKKKDDQLMNDLRQIGHYLDGEDVEFKDEKEEEKEKVPPPQQHSSSPQRKSLLLRSFLCIYHNIFVIVHFYLLFLALNTYLLQQSFQKTNEIQEEEERKSVFEFWNQISIVFLIVHSFFILEFFIQFIFKSLEVFSSFDLIRSFMIILFYVILQQEQLLHHKEEEGITVVCLFVFCCSLISLPRHFYLSQKQILNSFLYFWIRYSAFLLIFPFITLSELWILWETANNIIRSNDDDDDTIIPLEVRWIYSAMIACLLFECIMCWKMVKRRASIFRRK